MFLVNGWTGGQYSVFRVALGVYLCVHFAALLPYGAELFSNVGMLARAADSPLYPLFPNLLFWYDAPVVVSVLLTLGVASAAGLMLGWRDRELALVVFYVWACLFTRNPLISNPSLPFIGWLLLAHALLPRAPYGSWDARGRPDPGGGWHMSPHLYGAAWLVLALSYSYSGYTKLLSPSWLDGTALARVLDNPLARPTFLRDLVLALPAPLLALGTWGALALELAFAPLAVFRRVRPWVWLVMVLMHVGLMGLIDFADLSLGMLLVHAFTFDPAWVRGRGAAATVYYDGACGFCHRTVRFLLSEDREAAFHYAPLESESFAAAVPVADRATLPDSIVVVDDQGSVLMRSRAILSVMLRLGGIWRVGALAIGTLPESILDPAYDAFAAIRSRLFARPDEACPLVPPDLRRRFKP